MGRIDIGCPAATLLYEKPGKSSLFNAFSIMKWPVFRPAIVFF
jgi:hypothetical protein